MGNWLNYVVSHSKIREMAGVEGRGGSVTLWLKYHKIVDFDARELKIFRLFLTRTFEQRLTSIDIIGFSKYSSETKTFDKWFNHKTSSPYLLETDMKL